MKPTTVIPLVVAALLFAAIGSANRRGIRDQYDRPWLKPATTASLTHSGDRWILGWPVACDVSCSTSMQTQTCVVRLTAPLGFTRRWAVVKTWVAFLHGIALTLNLVAGAMVVVGVFLGLRAWCEMHPWKIRFSIRFVLLTTSIIAVGFALRDDVALVTDAFAFWDDLYEIRRFTTLLALDVGFGSVILWVIVRRVRWFAGAASSTDQPTTNHGCTPSHRVILGLGVARSRFLFTIWT